MTPLERKYAAVNFKQDISDSVHSFTEVNWNSSKTYNSTIEPTPFTTDDVYLPSRGGVGGIKRDEFFLKNRSSSFGLL